MIWRAQHSYSHQNNFTGWTINP